VLRTIDDSRDAQAIFRGISDALRNTPGTGEKLPYILESSAGKTSGTNSAARIFDCQARACGLEICGHTGMATRRIAVKIAQRRSAAAASRDNGE